MSDRESVPEALVTAGVHWSRRDYDAAEDAILGALGRLRKEKQSEVQTHAE